HRAVFADAAKIVAAEVDEHDVLGTLLFARQHFALEALVFRFVFAAATRASDGPIKDVASLNLDEHFRGAADHGNVVELKIEKIGRGIQSAQLAIDFKRTSLRFHREALAQHDLENIAGPDVLLGLSNDVQVFRSAEIRRFIHSCPLGRLPGSFRAFRGDRFFEKLVRLPDLAHRSVVVRPQAAMAFGENIADNPQTVLDVIEGDEPVVEHEHSIVKADFILQALGKALDEANHVVAEVADRSRNQRRQARQPNGAEALDALAQERDGIALFPNESLAIFQDASAIAIAKNFLWMSASERIARDFLAAFYAFQEKRVPRALRDAEIGAHRGQKVGGKYIVNRDEVSLFRETLEFAEVGLNHGRTSLRSDMETPK